MIEPRWSSSVHLEMTLSDAIGACRPKRAVEGSLPSRDPHASAAGRQTTYRADGQGEEWARS
jgi:hypothetical protein